MSARWTDGEDEAYVDVVLRRRMVRTAFQPIVRLETGLPAAFYALTRGPLGSPLEAPDRLIAAASARGVAVELDRLCFLTALDAAQRAHLSAPLSIFTRRDAAALLQSRVREDAAACGVPVVLELVATTAPSRTIVDAAARARDAGYGVALRHPGLDDATPALTAAVLPDFVEVPASTLEHDATIVAQLERPVVMFGLDTEYATETAIALGIQFGYGLRFGRPDLLVRAPLVFDHAGLTSSSGLRVD